MQEENATISEEELSQKIVDRMNSAMEKAQIFGPLLQTLAQDDGEALFILCAALAMCIKIINASDPSTKVEALCITCTDAIKTYCDSIKMIKVKDADVAKLVEDYIGDVVKKIVSDATGPSKTLH